MGRSRWVSGRVFWLRYDFQRLQKPSEYGLGQWRRRHLAELQHWLGEFDGFGIALVRSFPRRPRQWSRRGEEKFLGAYEKKGALFQV